MILGGLLRSFARGLAGRGARAGRPVPLSREVSIGMAAHGNSHTTRRALDALFASASGDFELVLVDDKSPDDTLDVFLEAGRRHRNTRIFSFAENLEYCQSVHAFLSHAAGSSLLFLSNDIFASPAYLRELLRSAAAHPQCGILRGCSNFVDKGTALHMVPVPDFASREAYFAFAEEIALRHAGEAPRDERFLVGDAFLVQRRVLERIGGFDTRFVGYFGDVDFGLRAQLAGFRVVLERRAFAFHQKNANIDVLPVPQQRMRWDRRRRLVDAAATLFLDKYGVTLDQGGIDNVPWSELARREFVPELHYAAPKDYSAHRVR